MRMLLTLTGYVLAGCCLLCVLLYLLQRQLIYYPVAAQLPPTEPLMLQQADQGLIHSITLEQIATEISLSQVCDTAQRLLEGKVRGRIVVNVNPL